tara:strand:- start:113842 stop:114021 length:180 start_codon:yes stop_codon:yes gene_type:complete
MGVALELIAKEPVDNNLDSLLILSFILPIVKVKSFLFNLINPSSIKYFSTFGDKLPFKP